ncbi:MAG: DUF4258 domain-containing protein [Chlorobi bacterium]|nr:DUF4258 domain-containing protein [Chlorobiota bacterium]
MKLIQRTGYYLAGFSIGIVILAFIWKGKKTEFNYFPDARVLKNINTKQQLFSNKVKMAITNKTIDTIAISYILKKGDVNFSKSQTKRKPCKIYVIEGDYNDKEIVLTVENCDSIATIQDVSVK